MTKERKYYDKGKCPVCNSENISYYNNIEKDGDYIYYKAVCDDCKTGFDEYYEVIYAGIENISKMKKMFNFSVNEISGRTFELPYDEAIEFIKENCQNEDIDVDTITDYELADLLWKYHGNLEKYELQNDTFQSEIDETKVFELKDSSIET